MKAVEKMSHVIRKVVLAVLVIFAAAGMTWAQEHDVVITPAPDVTSLSPADWKSPDIKIGADFGVTSPPDIIQRGVANHIYARFLINGTKDHELSSGDVRIKFYWRDATVGTTPPALDHSSWHLIGTLPATYIKSTDGPFAITRVWPTDFPSVTSKYVTWTPLASGDKYHIAAKLEYAGSITDENPDDNVAISLYESQSGLLDIVLLHDVSGSMGTYTYGGYSYMQHAISKASMFIASMPQTHRFSVVAFPEGYPAPLGYKDVWPLSPPKLRPATDPNKASAITAIAGLTAYGGTSLGQGLQRAIQILTTPLVPDRKKVIIVLSDGEENMGTPRACSGSDPANPCVGGTLMSQLQTNNIKVFTVALGAHADVQCLSCLAAQSGGQWYSSPTASLTLSKVYLDVMQDASADDLYRVDSGTIGTGANTYSTYFEGVDNSLYFVLSWEDLDAKLELELAPPLRTSLNKKVFEGKGYQVIKVYNPPKGTWNYTVNGPAGKKYLVAVRSDHVGVQMRLTGIADQGIVGLPIKIKAQLFYGKEPITEARVTAAVQIPVGPSLETILQQSSREHLLETRTLPVLKPTVLQPLQPVQPVQPVRPVQPTRLVRQVVPDTSIRSQFIKKIMGNREELVKTRTVPVQLRHIGNGFYEGVLKEDYTTTAGEYTITVESTHPKFHRNFSKQVRLHPGDIDYEKSYADVIRLQPTSGEEEAHTWVLQVYAVDHFGNAITDASLMERVVPQVKGAKVTTSKITLGTIQKKLSTFEGQRPELEVVTLDGRELRIEHRE